MHMIYCKAYLFNNSNIFFILHVIAIQDNPLLISLIFVFVHKQHMHVSQPLADPCIFPLLLQTALCDHITTSSLLVYQQLNAQRRTAACLLVFGNLML